MGEGGRFLMYGQLDTHQGEVWAPPACERGRLFREGPLYLPVAVTKSCTMHKMHIA